MGIWYMGMGQHAACQYAKEVLGTGLHLMVSRNLQHMRHSRFRSSELKIDAHVRCALTSSPLFISPLTQACDTLRRKRVSRDRGRSDHWLSLPGIVRWWRTPGRQHPATNNVCAWVSRSSLVFDAHNKPTTLSTLIVSCASPRPLTMRYQAPLASTTLCKASQDQGIQVRRC